MKEHFSSKKNKRTILLALLVACVGFVSYSPVEKRETKPEVEKGLIMKGAEKSGYTEVNTRNL